MKPFTAYALIWVFVSLTIMAGLFFTRSIHCLWFLVIPGCLNLQLSQKEGD